MATYVLLITKSFSHGSGIRMDDRFSEGHAKNTTLLVKT